MLARVKLPRPGPIRFIPRRRLARDFQLESAQRLMYTFPLATVLNLLNRLPIRASFLFAVAAVVLSVPRSYSQALVEEVHADLSDARKNVIRAELKIPVKSGPLTLVYPKWLPGNGGLGGPNGSSKRASVEEPDG